MVSMRKMELKYQTKLGNKNPDSVFSFTSYRYHFIYFIKKYDPEAIDIESEFSIPKKKDYFVIHCNTLEEFIYGLNHGILLSSLSPNFIFTPEDFFCSPECKALLETKSFSLLNVIKYIDFYLNSNLKKKFIQVDRKIILSQSIMFIQAEKDIKFIINELSKVKLQPVLKKGAVLPFDVEIDKIKKGPISYLPFSGISFVESSYDKIIFPKEKFIPAGSVIVDGAFTYKQKSEIEKSSLIADLQNKTSNEFLEIFNYDFVLDFDDINNYYLFSKDFWKSLKQIKTTKAIINNNHFNSSLVSLYENERQKQKIKELKEKSKSEVN